LQLERVFNNEFWTLAEHFVESSEKTNRKGRGEFEVTREKTFVFSAPLR